MGEQQATAAPAMRSEAQQLADRQSALFERKLRIHHRLVQVRQGIVSGPAPSGSHEPHKPERKKDVAFFAALGDFTAADEAVTAAIEADVEDLARIFGVSAPAEPQKEA